MIRILHFSLLNTIDHYRHICKRMSHYVFVYGTLKRNEPNHYWLTNPDNGCGKFVSEGMTKKKYPLVIATKYNIPFVLYSPGNGHQIKGEIYSVDDKMLANLDILEDYPKWYIREIEEIIVKTPNSTKEETMKCWLYFLKNFKPDLLEMKLYESYSSNGPHGLKYLESDNEATLEDLKELLKK
ncbi:unnamed protein product [Leptosia nina]|uniref:Gamma-glutamylcyclotransferase family protein n=1 Tax=Leptosia nina TaxID=320188 RepID=A0AAV1JHN1_9NEOP